MEIRISHTNIIFNGDDFTIIKNYPIDDPIWNLDLEKIKRKTMADMQKILIAEADKACHNKVVERG